MFQDCVQMNKSPPTELVHHHHEDANISLEKIHEIAELLFPVSCHATLTACTFPRLN